MAKRPSLKNLSNIKAKSIERIIFRNIRLGYNPINDTGSLKRGGRWNIANRYGALYSSTDRKTCVRELEREAKRRGLEIEDLQPREIVSLKVRIKNVLDLTDHEILSLLGISEEDLISEDYTLTQEISDAARKLGYEAILSPSATGKGKNLNIYLDMLSDDSLIEIVKTEILEI